ncbi:hypothetical protein OG883_44000 [Streptomyces sp. NBC_01142]|uniref:hypothetical protein n=1 Tax=Streptomyces sp. NBC_01142 TaxID=2975865 RepID=UPI0022530632|nr:hypothetical protein [Streptomyces sp. NBC_01142]MCX4826606.1 hypothetical protein [Streptomyces sp. NBC_01142]
MDTTQLHRRRWEACPVPGMALLNDEVWVHPAHQPSLATRPNSITGGVQTGTVIMAGTIGGLNLDANDGITTLTGSPDGELDAMAAEFTVEFDRPGPRLAVLTSGETAAVHTLITLVEGTATQLAPLAAALTARLTERAAEYGPALRGLTVATAEFNVELDRPGPRLAVLTKGESRLAYALLAAVAGIRPDLDPVAETVASRLIARVREYDA